MAVNISELIVLLRSLQKTLEITSECLDGILSGLERAAAKRRDQAKKIRAPVFRQRM